MSKLGCEIPSYSGTVPVVKYCDGEIVECLKSFFEIEGEINYINSFLGLVFIRLGFTEQDNIILDNFNALDCSFDCLYNSDDSCRIKVNKDSREIVRLFDTGEEHGYVCEDDEYSEIGSRITLGRLTTKLSDRVVYTRSYSRKDMKFRYDFGDLVLELEMIMPETLPVIKNGEYTRYTLRLEEQLNKFIVKYDGLVSDLFVLYYDIRDLYVGDVSQYSKFMFRKFIKTDKGLKLTDMVSLKNGDMSCIVRTIDDKTVRLFANGGWQYTLCKSDSKSMIVNSGCGDSENDTPKEVKNLRELVRRLRIKNVS